MSNLYTSTKTINHSFGLSLDLKGIRLVNYYDVGGVTDEEGSEVVIPYASLKYDLLDSSIICKQGLGHEKSIEQNDFKMPNDENTAALLAEVRKLKEFAEELEKSIVDSIVK